MYSMFFDVQGNSSPFYYKRGLAERPLVLNSAIKVRLRRIKLEYLSTTQMEIDGYFIGVVIAAEDKLRINIKNIKTTKL